MSEQSEAYRAGYDHGQARGSWVLDGNSTVETARRIVEGYNDGDPEIMDMQPAPLSGEWAGESIPEMSDYFDMDLSDETVADDFEQGFSDGYWTEILTTAREMFGVTA